MRHHARDARHHLFARLRAVGGVQRVAEIQKILLRQFPAQGAEGGAAAARALLALPMQPNAVICANQYIAFGCVNELKVSGIRIPEDMAVITFDDFPFSKIIEPQLSVVNLDMFDMGEQAAKVVLRRIRTPQYLVQSQTTLPILIERQSTKKLL